MLKDGDRVMYTDGENSWIGTVICSYPYKNLSVVVDFGKDKPLYHISECHLEKVNDNEDDH